MEDTIERVTAQGVPPHLSLDSILLMIQSAERTTAKILKIFAVPKQWWPVGVFLIVEK